jgi:hypothetical protein
MYDCIQKENGESEIVPKWANNHGEVTEPIEIPMDRNDVNIEFLRTYTVLRTYVGTKHTEFHSITRRIYNGIYVSEEDRQRIDHLINEIKQMSSDMATYRSPDLKTILKENHFYVHRGGRAPFINSCEDIYRVTLFYVYSCTSFLSTSCSYDVGRVFCEKSEKRTLHGNLKYKRATSDFLVY